MFEDLDDAFRQMKKRKYVPYAEALSAYRDALLDQGFTRHEALRILEIHTKYLYDNMYEEDDLGDMLGNGELPDGESDEDDPYTS